MGSFFVYILKASVCLATFYLFYRLLLSKETFHRFNRIALSGIFILSLIIPLCEITIRNHTEVQQTLVNMEQLIAMANVSLQTTTAPEIPSTPLWIPIMLFAYVAGILFFFGRNIYSFIQMLRLLRTGQKEKLEKGITLIVHDKDITPFSWMKYIVISRKDLEENSKEILTHEIAHIRNRHSVDLLIADFCICFQWFNPASWLLKQELQNIHEYEADDTVLRQGINAKQYQLLLIKKAVGTRLYSMANSFNHSKLKKRITMMLKEKSNPWARAKYLYVLPLAATVLTAFARPEISDNLNEISDIKVKDITSILETKAANNVATVKDSLPEKSNIKTYVVEDDSTLVTFYSYADSLVSISVMSDTLKYKNVIVSAEPSVIYVKDTIIDGKTSIVTITTGGKEKVMVKSSAISRKIIPDTTNVPLYILEGKEIDENTIFDLNPEMVKTITVLKDQSAISTYGTKAKNGVIVIELFKPEEVTSRSSYTIRSLSANDSTNSVNIATESYIIFDTCQDVHEHPHYRLVMSKANVVKDKKLHTGEIFDEIKVLDKENAGMIHGKVYLFEGDIVPGIKNSPSVIRIIGTVQDQDGNPLKGATITTEGVETKTNSDGTFLLITGKDDKLTITYPGMKKVKVKASKNLTIYMKKL